MKANRTRSVLVYAALAVFLLGGCSEASSQPADKTATTAARPAAQRWYQPAQVARGAALYAKNCSTCHGKAGEGAPGWQGSALAPPLNGTGHAWHHPLGALGYQIKFGVPGGQGTMPGFASSLQDDDILDIIAWFQSQWPDDIYGAWVRIEIKSRQGKQ